MIKHYNNPDKLTREVLFEKYFYLIYELTHHKRDTDIKTGHQNYKIKFKVENFIYGDIIKVCKKAIKIIENDFYIKFNQTDDFFYAYSFSIDGITEILIRIY